MSQKGIARCPRCDRTIATDCGRYKQHSLVPAGGVPCPFSGQHIPITGHTPTDYLSRGYLVADLAEQVQDMDCAVVWELLTATPADELQRLLMLALAAVPTDKPLAELYAWVVDLPASKLKGETA